MRLVAGDSLLDEGIDDQQREDQTHDHGHRDRGRDGVAANVELPIRPQPDQAVGPHQVEVGLAARRHLRRLVRTQLPDRVDLQQATHQAEDAGHHREELVPDFTANTGITRTPTTFVSVRPGPGNWVCFWNHTKAR